MATWLRVRGYRERADAADALSLKDIWWADIEPTHIADRYLVLSSSETVRKLPPEHQLNEAATEMLEGRQVRGDALLINAGELMQHYHRGNVTRVKSMLRAAHTTSIKFMKYMEMQFRRSGFASVALAPKCSLNFESLKQSAVENFLTLGRNVKPVVLKPMVFSSTLEHNSEDVSLIIFAMPELIAGLAVSRKAFHKAVWNGDDMADVSFMKIWDGRWHIANETIDGLGEPVDASCPDTLRWHILSMLAWSERGTVRKQRTLDFDLDSECDCPECGHGWTQPIRVDEMDCVPTTDGESNEIAASLVDRLKALHPEELVDWHRQEQDFLVLRESSALNAAQRRRATVAGFMQLQATVAETAMGLSDYRFMGDQALHDASVRHFSAHISRARLYEFDPNVPVRMARSILKALRREHERVHEWLLTEAQKDMPPPSRERPSSMMYIAFGEGPQIVGLAEEELVLQADRSGRKLHDNYKPALLGYGITPSVVYAVIDDAEAVSILNVWHGADLLPGSPELAGWVPNLSLAAWIVPWLIELLNAENSRVIQEGFAQPSKKVKRTAKQLSMGRPTPRPFYTVHVNDTFDHKPRKSGVPRSIRAEFQHRWSVDAHTRMYVQRGMLPLDPKRKALLLKRKYTVCEGPVDERCAAGLARRSSKHLPQRPGEWIAYRFRRVKEHLSPARDDLPIIPSVKRVRRINLEEQ